MVSPKTTLSDGKVTLRPFEPKDQETYLRWVNDPEIMTLVDRYRPVTRADHRKWYREMTQKSDRIVFAVDRASDGVFVGNVWLHGIDEHHRKAEVRIVFGRNLGEGLGTAALKLLRDYAFRKVDLEKVYAYVLGINPRAKRAFERAGFRREATLKADRRVGNRRVDVDVLACWSK
jgi:RimJ/RimL family protein N-acetyltransferase